MIKLNKISIEFTDLSDSIAGIKVLLDPPLEEGVKIEDIESSDQPCIMLATKVLGFLNFLQTATQEGEQISGEQGNNLPVIH
jgi:hypothetical protein